MSNIIHLISDIQEDSDKQGNILDRKILQIRYNLCIYRNALLHELGEDGTFQRKYTILKSKIRIQMEIFFLTYLHVLKTCS